jgi:alpha/beta hydrolase fold
MQGAVCYFATVICLQYRHTEAVPMSVGARASSSLPETFPFEGQAVRFGSLGRADRPPLVLLHGTPFSSVVWRRIAPHLTEHRRVYYFDLLGYGRSEMRSDQSVSLVVQGRLFAALLGHWRLSKPDVVAHDSLYGFRIGLRTIYPASDCLRRGGHSRAGVA